MKRINKILPIMVLLLMLTTAIYAQGPGFDEDVVDEQVPLDGGASALIVATAAYGIKKIREKRLKTNIASDKAKK